MADNSPIPEARAQIGQFLRLAPQVEEAIFGSEDAQRAARDQQSAAITNRATALAGAAIGQAEIQINEQETVKQLLSAVGLDINDPHSMLNEELTREQSKRREREQLRSEITQLQSVSFWENPLAFFMNQPQIQKNVARHNQLADEENRSTAEIARMQSLATTIKNLTPARNADMIRQHAVQTAEAIKQEAAASAAQISQQNAAGHAKAMLDAFTLRKNIFDQVLQINQLEESIKDRRERAAEQQFWRNITRQDRLEKEEEKKALKAQEGAIVTGINLYRRMLSGGSTPDWTIDDLKRMPADQRELWIGTVFRGNLGNHYGQSIPFIDTFGNVADAANSGNASMMMQVRAIREQALALVPEIKNKYRAQNMGKDLKDTEALQQAYETLYQRDRSFAVRGSDKSALPAGSVYAFDWDALAANAIKNKDTGVVGSILTDAKTRNPGANLSAVMTPRGFLSEVEARVASKQLDPKTAAEQTAQFFALQSVRNYEDFGLKYLALPQMTDFVIAPGRSGREKVDLMNATQLESYLTARVAERQRVERAGVLNRGIMHWTEGQYKK